MKAEGTSQAQDHDEDVWLGGCHGFICLGRDELTDYYRAQSWVVRVGISCFAVYALCACIFL